MVTVAQRINYYRYGDPFFDGAEAQEDRCDEATIPYCLADYNIESVVVHLKESGGSLVEITGFEMNYEAEQKASEETKDNYSCSYGNKLPASTTDSVTFSPQKQTFIDRV